LFANLWLAPFLDAEPESTWVLELNQEVHGYLVAAIRPGFPARAARTLAPHVLRLIRNRLQGRYRHHPASERFVRWFLTRSWKEVPKHPPGLTNFHFNLSDAALGDEARWGDILMATYFDRIRSLGHNEFYVHVFASASKRALDFYRHVGFRIFDVRMSTLFQEPTAVASLVRKIPDTLEFQKERNRNLAKVTLVMQGDESRYQQVRMMEIAQQVLPAKDVRWNDDHGIQSQIVVYADAAKTLPPHALAKCVARYDFAVNRDDSAPFIQRI
jgi:hypothetical protein